MNGTERNFLWDNLLSMAAYWAGSGTVIAALTSFYALSLPLSNLITGFTSTLLILQLFGGIGYTKSRCRPRFLRLFNVLWRLCLPLTFLSVLLPRAIGAWAMQIFYFLTVALCQYVTPAQTEWTVKSVEGHVGKNYFAQREMTFMLGYSVIFCVFNLSLNLAQKSDAMGTAFLIIGLLLAGLMGASIAVLFRLPPPAQPAERPTHSGAIWRQVGQNKPFLSVLLTGSMWFLSGMFIGSFGSLYQIRILHLSFAQIMLWATVGNLLRALLIPVMARLAARVGWKNTLFVSMSMMLAAAICWFFVRSETAVFLFPLVSILAALPYAGVNVAFLQLQVDHTPEATRSIYFSANAVGNGLASFAGTILCSVLIGGIEHAFGAAANDYYRYAFLIGAAGIAATMALSRTIPDRGRGGNSAKKQ
ncbi:MAG: MFS transporter [Pseudoflavonifractor sp.]